MQILSTEEPGRPMDRRNYERFKLGEDARALDPSGRERGTVSHAGGGGMRIEANTLAIAQELEIAKDLKLLVFEPESKITHKVEISVRYRHGKILGAQFISITE